MGIFIMEEFISEGLFVENKLTRMIGAGMVSKDGVIRAGKAGMIPSKRRTTIGVLKGLENKMKKYGVRKVRNIDNHLNTQYNNSQDKLTLPRNTEHRIVYGSHEGNEVAYNYNKANTYGTNSILGHRSVGVLSREKEFNDKLGNMYRGSKLGRVANKLTGDRSKYEGGLESKIQGYATNASKVRKLDRLYNRIAKLKFFIDGNYNRNSDMYKNYKSKIAELERRYKDMIGMG